MNDVFLIINGAKYGGWKDVEITRSMETLSGRFRLGLTEKWPGQTTPRPIRLADTCTVKIGNDTVITGYMDDIEQSYDAASHTLTIAGRDKSGDLVDCSAKHSPGQWKNQPLEAIVQDLTKPFNIQVITEIPTGERFKTFAIEQGETVHEVIERLCKLRGVLCIPDGEGNIIITRTDSSKSAVALITGENILKGAIQLSAKDQFSNITVKGQTEGSDTAKPKVNTTPSAESKDPSVKRYRPLVLLAEGQADGATCQKRADWETATRKAKGFEAQYSVIGWRQGFTGPLWGINQRVRVRDKVFKVDESLIISGITFRLDDQNGRITELILAKPEAFAPNPSDLEP
jgi:prophage tail gpP-like protein